MRIPRVHEPVDLALQQRFSLSEPNRQHLALALRLEVGARLQVFDGRGNEFLARVEAVTRRRMDVCTLEAVTPLPESPVAVTIGLGMSLGDRMEYAIQKATELGVQAIVPLQCERSELRLTGQRAARKQERWQRIAISACEQSGRATLPRIGMPMTPEEWLQKLPADALNIFLHHENPEALGGLDRPRGPLHVLIGPEGGLSANELIRCRAAGLQAIRLGPRVLRTETAPVALLSAVQTLWGDFQA